MPHVANRPLTLVRCPDGVGKECFYQRHLNMGVSPGDVLTFKRLRSSKGRYIYVNSVPGVLSVVQNGAVEFHTWGATPAAKHPDRITIDLDPDPELPWRQVMEGATLTRALIEGLKPSFSQDDQRQGSPRRLSDQAAPHLGRGEGVRRASPNSWCAPTPRASRRKSRSEPRRQDLRRLSAQRRDRECRRRLFAARPARAHVSTPLDWDELDSTDIRGAFSVRNIPLA